MKKMFLIGLLFFSTVFSDIDRTYNSINAVLNDPYKPWHLLVDESEGIAKAPFFYKLYYRIISAFSSAHQEELEKALEEVLIDAANNDTNFSEDKKKISLEKICTILANKSEKFWFQDIYVCPGFLKQCQMDHWTYNTKHALEEEGFMQPFQRDGYFFNDENEKLSQLSMTEMSVFIKSLMSASSKMNLKELELHDPVLARSDNLSIQWLGHSSFLIQIEGLNILVDPVTEAFHPLFGGLIKCFKRYIPFGVAFCDLPKIDVIMISHNHLDHLEDKILFYLKRFQPQILVPQGLKQYFEEKGFDNVKEHMWWDKTVALSDRGTTISLYCVPARHNSMTRGSVKSQKSLWSGWVIGAGGKHIYFAGDTAFNEDMFYQIKERFGSIDVALLPIAPDKMRERHTDLLEALNALSILDAKTMIPMHWGAYRTGDEKVEDPYLQIKEEEHNPQFNGRIKVLKVGQRYTEE